MTDQDQTEYEKAQMLLREAKPDWLKRMAPESPLVPVPVPERQARMDLGMTPIALIGDRGGGGGAGADAGFTAIVITDGILRYATVNGTLGAIIT